jgi:hypothetical protein
MLNGIVIAQDFKPNAAYPGITGTPGVPDGIFSTGVHWAPRFGFAYEPTGSGKTAIRGGFGVSYGRTPFALYNNDLANPPFTTGVTLLNGTLAEPSLGVAAPLSAVSIGSVGRPNQTFNPVQTMSYSLTVEHQVIPDGVLSVAYVGSDSTNLPGGQDLNYPLPVAAPTINNPACLSASESSSPAGGFNFDPCINMGLVSADYTRPNKGWSAISGASNSAAQYNGRGNYNSLQVGFQYRAHHGLTLTAAYTYGRSFSDVYYGAQNPRNWRVEYAPVGYDRDQMFTSSYIYDLPFLKGRKDTAGKVLGGWSFSGITVAESGFPNTIGLSIPTPGLASRPNCVASVSGPKTPSQWFNTNAFTAPAFGFFGNCGNGIVMGPGLSDWDWALYKKFPIGERLKMTMRFEAFNIWNHPSFSGVSTGYGSGSFGQLTSALDPREFQFALRFDF